MALNSALNEKGFRFNIEYYGLFNLGLSCYIKIGECYFGPKGQNKCKQNQDNFSKNILELY
jgi:hypothetical protein